MSSLAMTPTDLLSIAVGAASTFEPKASMDLLYEVDAGRAVLEWVELDGKTRKPLNPKGRPSWRF